MKLKYNNDKKYMNLKKKEYWIGFILLNWFGLGIASLILLVTGASSLIQSMFQLWLVYYIFIIIMGMFTLHRLIEVGSILLLGKKIQVKPILEIVK